MKIETKAIHAGRKVDPTTGAVSEPIYLSTTFERQADGSYPTGFVYSRDSNPNRNALEECITALEGGTAAAAFASGSVAAMVIFQALSPGNHVIVPEDLYFGVRVMLRDHFAEWGLEASFVDMTDEAAIEQAIRPNTKLILAETPSNPLIKITDIGRVADIAHSAGAYFVCDNTIATPIFQQPFAHGADMVIHSATKYLSGSDDAMCGLIVTREESDLFKKTRTIQRIGGAIPSPFTCWLTLRGIQTLPCRMRAHAENAIKVAEFLNDHPKIESVFFPGLTGNAGYQIASKQMSLPGAMMSILVRGGREAAMAVAAKVSLFIRATSFGGPQSLIEHRASVEAPGTKTPDNLLRMAIGLENAEDMIDDLAQAPK